MTPTSTPTPTVTPTRGTPALVVNKQLVQSPGNPAGIVALGIEITFTIRITNTGTTALTVVPLQDIYDASYLTFVRANPAPTSSAPGGIQWSNLLPVGTTLRPGFGLTVTVTFLTRATTDNQSNRQTLNIASVPNVQDEFGQQPPSAMDMELVRIARSAVIVEKTIVSPSLASIGVGADITFGIRVENVGEVTLIQVPVYDLYEADVLRYLRSSISQPRVTVVGANGELFWADITNDVGNLIPGQVAQFTVTFRMIAPRITTNLVRVNNVVDANNDAVPPVQGEGSMEVIPAAPPIYQLYAPIVGGQPVLTPTPTGTPTPIPTSTPTSTPTPLSLIHI